MGLMRFSGRAEIYNFPPAQIPLRKPLDFGPCGWSSRGFLARQCVGFVFALKVLSPQFGSLILGTLFQVRRFDLETEPPIAVAAPHARAHKASPGRTAQRTHNLVK